MNFSWGHVISAVYTTQSQFYINHMYDSPGAYVVRSNVTHPKLVYVDTPIQSMTWKCPPHRFDNEVFEVKIAASSGMETNNKIYRNILYLQIGQVDQIFGKSSKYSIYIKGLIGEPSIHPIYTNIKNSSFIQVSKNKNNPITPYSPNNPMYSSLYINLFNSLLNWNFLKQVLLLRSGIISALITGVFGIRKNISFNKHQTFWTIRSSLAELKVLSIYAIYLKTRQLGKHSSLLV